MSQLPTPSPQWPTHYRIYDRLTSDGVYVCTELFRVIRESEKCYWVVSSMITSALTVDELIKRKIAKRILKKSERSLCHPTIEKALKSYIRRKTMQQWHAETALQTASKALDSIDKIKQGVESSHILCTNIGTIKKHEEIIWDY